MAELMLIPFVTFRLMVYNTSHYCYLKLETTKDKHCCYLVATDIVT